MILNSSDGKIYQYAECYIRTSSKEYAEFDADLDPEEQIQMQLTNNAVQKDDADYGKFEEGNIISMHTLFDYIAQSKFNINGQTKSQLMEAFQHRMVTLIQDSVKAVKGKIVH